MKLIQIASAIFISTFGSKCLFGMEKEQASNSSKSNANYTPQKRSQKELNQNLYHAAKDGKKADVEELINAGANIFATSLETEIGIISIGSNMLQLAMTESYELTEEEYLEKIHFIMNRIVDNLTYDQDEYIPYEFTHALEWLVELSHSNGDQCGIEKGLLVTC